MTGFGTGDTAPLDDHGVGVAQQCYECGGQLTVYRASMMLTRCASCKRFYRLCLALTTIRQPGFKGMGGEPDLPERKLIAPVFVPCKLTAEAMVGVELTRPDHAKLPAEGDPGYDRAKAQHEELERIAALDAWPYGFMRAVVNAGVSMEDMARGLEWAAHSSRRAHEAAGYNVPDGGPFDSPAVGGFDWRPGTGTPLLHKPAVYIDDEGRATRVRRINMRVGEAIEQKCDKVLVCIDVAGANATTQCRVWLQAADPTEWVE